MKQQTTEATNYSSRIKKRNLHYILFSIAWATSLIFIELAASQGHSTTALPLLLILLNMGIGVGMILAYIRVLKVMDELEQKIQLNALALSVGFGCVGSMTYSLLAKAGFAPQAGASEIVTFIVLVYIASIFIGQIRYR